MTKKYEEQHDELRFLKKKLTDYNKVSENSTNLPSQNNNNNFHVLKNTHFSNDILSNEHNEIISSK